MAKNLLWLAAALNLVSSAVAIPEDAHITPAPVLRARLDDQIKAIVPTTSGQIGVNPVDVSLGSPDDYLLTALGPDNLLVTYNGQTYQYIEAHTRYLSLESITTTVDNKPTTTTESVKVSIETGVAGGVGLVFSEDVASALRTSADSAISACGLKKRSLIVPRADSISCLIDAAVKASGENGPLEAAGTDAFWETIAADVAANAPEYLASAIAVIKSQAQKKKALIILSAMIVGTKVAGNIAAVNIPKGGVGAPDKTDSNKCDPNAAANKDSPICSDSTCKGSDDSPKCTVDPNKGCACLLVGTDEPPQPSDQDWWDQQQAVFASFAANHNLIGSAAPSCFVNSDGNAFDGKPAATPASWCVCDTDGTKRIYPTVDKASAPCSYSAIPTATISPKVTATSGGKVTSCRQETASGTGVGSGPYCTCNDNSMYPVATWTDAGKPTTGCQATSTSATAAKATPTCNVNKKFTINQDSLISAADKFCTDNEQYGYLRSIPINPYSNALTGYNPDGASSGGQLYMFAYLDKGCDTGKSLDVNDCKTAYQSIFDSCDKGASQRQGGAASVNCGWFNITAVDKCMGSSGSITNPGSCNVGNLPGGYGSWPLGTIP